MPGCPCNSERGLCRVNLGCNGRNVKKSVSVLWWLYPLAVPRDLNCSVLSACLCSDTKGGHSAAWISLVCDPARRLDAQPLWSFCSVTHYLDYEFQEKMQLYDSSNIICYLQVTVMDAEVIWYQGEWYKWMIWKAIQLWFKINLQFFFPADLVNHLIGYSSKF